MDTPQPEESFLHRKIVQVTFWLLERKNSIFYGFLSLVALIFFVSRYVPLFQKDEQMLSSEKIYRTWLENREDEKSWKNLSEELQKNDFLKGKYASDIAQRWIGRDELERAKPLMKDAFQKLNEDLDYYALFSQTTCVIAEGKMEKALQEAVDLKKKMIDDPLFSKGSLLYGHSLMRILFLAKTLQNNKAAEDARVELENYLQKNQTSLLCAKEEDGFLKNTRKNKQIGLADFLAEQKSLLPEN